MFELLFFMIACVFVTKKPTSANVSVTDKTIHFGSVSKFPPAAGLPGLRPGSSSLPVSFLSRPAPGSAVRKLQPACLAPRPLVGQMARARTGLRRSPAGALSDWDMDVQGPGFERGFDHVLEHFLKTKLRKYHRFGSDSPPARRPG